MSGLLVKSHAHHARQPRGAERPRPGRHPGAARRRRAHPQLRRARPPRGLRRPPLLRQGRLRGPPGHGPPRRDQARAATTTPTGAACRRESQGAGPRSASTTPTTTSRRALPARSPEVETDNQVFVPPFLGSKVVKGIPLDDIAAYINETALFRNQWQFRPERRDGKRPTRSSRPASGRPARAAGRGQGRRHARAPGRLRLLRRPTATATTS